MQESSLFTHPYSGFPSQTSSNSPDSSISLKISNPPRSSPFRMICGNAICQPSSTRLSNHLLGQSLIFFNPCLTSSSLRISNQANSTPFSLNRPTVCLENPHLGEEGFPFINKTTLCLFINSLHRAFSSSSVRGLEESAAGA